MMEMENRKTIIRKVMYGAEKWNYGSEYLENGKYFWSDRNKNEGNLKNNYQEKIKKKLENILGLIRKLK